MRSISRVIALAALAVALSPPAAIGQTVQPRLSVAAGGGIADPLHADFDFTAPAWHVSVRALTARHLAVEGFYEGWEHAGREVRLNQAIQGPGGFLGRVERIETVTTHGMRTAGLNVLWTGGLSRATFSGGGGVSLLGYDRRYNTAASGCDAAVADVCVAREDRFSSSTFALQGVAEVDVAVVKRVQVFGRYQIVAAVSDPGFGYGSLVGGVRVVVF